jgi:hypothetical protein
MTPHPSLKGLYDFAAGKPSGEAYTWRNNEECACAQYSHALGMQGAEWFKSGVENEDIWQRLNLAARIDRDADDARTFGELANRLKELV